MKGERSKWKRELRLTLGLVAIVLLAAAVFTLGSLNIPLHPEKESGLVVLFALSTFMFAALLVFSSDNDQELGPSVERTAHRADGLAFQGQDGFRCAGRLLAAGRVFVFLQLRFIESDAKSLVPPALGNSQRRKPGASYRLRQR